MNCCQDFTESVFSLKVSDVELNFEMMQWYDTETTMPFLSLVLLFLLSEEEDCESNFLTHNKNGKENEI